MRELDEYETLAAPAEAAFKREGSRFIGLAFPVDSAHDATRKLDAVRTNFPDATHHCWALRVQDGNHLLERGHDDGEPLNSAGPPILQVLTGRGLQNVLVVVVRYFGGTKLGVGGLIRAYGEAAKAALAAAQIVTKIPQVRLTIRYPHACTGAVMGVLHRNQVTIDGVEHAALPQARVTLARARRDGLARQLVEACAGRVEVLDD